MLVANEKPTGTNYTATVALLIVAFVFIPVILITSRPISYFSLAGAIVCSLVCISLARSNWTKFSQVSIPSIVDQGRRKNEQ